MNRDKKTKALDAIIKPMPTARKRFHVNWTDWGRMVERYRADYSKFEMNPDFQRGHVWTKKQQTHYIENMLRGVVPIGGTVLKMNCPNYMDENFVGDLDRGFQCVDGLQRITAIEEYMKGNVQPFGLSLEDFEGSYHHKLSSAFYITVEVYEFKTRAELLQFYLDLNDGGTQHTKEEIKRVKQLLKNS